MIAPTIRIRVTEPGTRTKTPGYQLGTDIRINERDLEAYCWQRMAKADVDLLAIVGAVALADRRSRRRRSTQWARRFRLELPVHEPDLWEAVGAQLSELLQWLTGDVWEFGFRARRRPDSALQLYLPSSAEPPDLVISYSGGLDSFAHACRVASQGKRALLVTTWHTGLPRVRPRGLEYDHVRVPIHLRAGHEREQTYRTRPFVYFSAAALAAKMRGARSVVVPEPGQGAIGPSLVPFGNEHPYRGTHPGFTSRLQSLLNQMWGSGAPSFSHPNIWMTKSMLVRVAMVDTDSEERWKLTRSCSRHISRTKGLGAAEDTQQCGVCGNCLLRRVALTVNGLNEGPYFWKDLRASELQACRGSVQTTKTDREVATYAILDIENLARVAVDKPGMVVATAMHEIAQALGLHSDQIEKNFKDLINAHSDEWRTFIERLPESSWLRAIAER